VTIQITILSFVIGTLIAMPMAVARQNGKGLGYRFSTAWVELSRNTPSVFQVYHVLFRAGRLPHQHIPSYAAVLIAMSFNNAGYHGRDLPGGSVRDPAQQLSASRSLGMTKCAELHPRDFSADVQGHLSCRMSRRESGEC
jgi:His/Glu/Gln/Arg/opine family amino acid ABC transporter permease subunit